MKYLILMSFILAGCYDKPESRLWSIKNDCRELAKLVEADSIELSDSKDGRPICTISKKKGFTYTFYDNAASGAVRGIKLMLNKDKTEALDTCVNKAECHEYKIHKVYECIIKCKKEVGYLD